MTRPPNHPFRMSGFTLVEMMVALLIFSMLSVAGVVLLRSAVDIGFKGEFFQVASTPPGELTQRLYDAITGIQYGKLPDPHGWNVRVPLPQPAAAATQSAG